MRNTSRILVIAALAAALSSPLCADAWRGWTLVEGGGVTDAAVAVTLYDGSLQLFAKGADGKLYHNREKTVRPFGWSNWTEVPGGGYTDAAPAVATQGGKLYLFAKGIKDRAVYVNRWDGKTWAGWSQVPGNGQTDVALAAVTHNNNIYLFGEGYADKKVYVNRFNGTTWTGWSEVPGGGYTDTAMAGTSSGGRIYLFARGIKDKGIYTNVMAANGKWGAWQRIGTATTRVGLGATWTATSAWVVAVDDTAGHIWTSGSSGGAWTAWSEIPGGGVTDAPVAATGTAGRISLFARTADGKIRVNTYR